jgi:hypothetical protein
MSLPDKIMGAPPNKLILPENEGKPRLDYTMVECFRYKDKRLLEGALLESYYRLVNNRCQNIHGFMVNSEWFTFKGSADGYTGVDYKNAILGGDMIIWEDLEGSLHETPDTRPSASAIREYTNSGIPICTFMDLPVWLFDTGLSATRIAVAIPSRGSWENVA